METLNEREFELVNILGSGEGINQRALAEKTGLSLGMINMTIRRMVTKGLIRIRQLDKKKVEYLLTSKGFAEKMRKSVNYTMKTVNSLSVIVSKLKKIVSSLNQNGSCDFIAVGEHDLIDLLEFAFKQEFKGEYKLTRMNNIPENLNGEIVLFCRESSDQFLNLPKDSIDVIKELSI